VDEAIAEVETQGLARPTAVMAVGTTLSRLTGFIRLAAMAYALGIVAVRADAYNVANNTPNIVYELVLGGVLTAVFVPVFVEWLNSRGREAAWEVARSVLSITAVVLTAIMVVTILAAPWIVRLYTVNVRPRHLVAERELATFFLRWFMPQIVFYGIGAVATGLLNAHRRFAAPMFAPILNNVVVIATMLAFAAMPGPTHPTIDGVTTAQRYLLAIGTTFGVVAMTVALWPSLRRLGFRFHWRLDWRSEPVRRIARLAGWVFVYVLVNQLGLLQIIVLSAGHTDFTAYISAFTFFQLPHAIFAVSIMTALLPPLSAHWAAQETGPFRELLARGIRSTAFVVVPAALGYIVLAQPVVRLLLQRGATTVGGADLVANVLVYFSLGLLPFSLFQLLLRSFYAMQDTRTPALINIAAVTLNVIVNFIYFPFLGVKGLALGNTTAYAFATIVSLVIIRRRLGGLELRYVVRGLTQVAVASAITAGVAYAAVKLVALVVSSGTAAGEFAEVVVGVGAGIGAYLLMVSAMHMPELSVLKGLIPSRFRR
jgi:putative peptidoglycan lipid II flippase